MSFMDELLGIKPVTDTPTPPIAMTIAGSDSGGGAGVQADLKTFTALRTHGTSVITLITAQNTLGVDFIQNLPAHIIRAQYNSLFNDLPPAAAKIGALGEESTIATVIELLQERPIEHLVIDPVMVSKHGDPLMTEPAMRYIRERLIEYALVVTPNRYEAEALTGRSVGDPSSMKDAAKRIFDLGARYVLIKGSHLDKIVRDYVYDGTGFVEFGADRVKSPRTHGSGCTFSAAITAKLAAGLDVMESIAFAREFITSAIAKAPELGEGISPVHPMHEYW